MRTFNEMNPEQKYRDEVATVALGAIIAASPYIDPENPYVMKEIQARARLAYLYAYAMLEAR